MSLHRYLRRITFTLKKKGNKQNDKSDQESRSVGIKIKGI